MPLSPFKLRCRTCNQPVPWPPPGPRCPRPTCRGPLQPHRNIIFDPTLIEPLQQGMWRYRHMLPPLPVNPITLGEGGTPLLPIPDSGINLYVKNESLNPTGSFKDRGAAMLINTVGDAQIVIDDSSGNAGAALAAYAARAGIRARVYAPEAAPQAKKDQITRYGAELVAVGGNRDEVTRVADEASADENVFYASHVWHPGYPLGLQTIAWEIWEQLGRRAPDYVLLPVGNGSMLRGVRWGFRSLQKGKYIPELPRLIAVQPVNCAPLLAQSRGDYNPRQYEATPTIADGVAIPNPPLMDAMWAAISKTKGQVVGVGEDEIAPAREQMARLGFFIEPTAALALAGLNQIQSTLPPEATVVLILTGHGFKAT